MQRVDLNQTSTRELNQQLHDVSGKNDLRWQVDNPNGKHALAVGIDAPAEVLLAGHVGYYCAGMNQQADITVAGNAGPGLAENMMSGTVRVTGNASQYAGASAHGGLLVIEGDASARCGISLKGADIVVGGSVGHMSAFMAQAGRLVVCGDAGHHLGDSLYEADLYVRGSVASLGADCVEKPLTDEHRTALSELLARSGLAADPADFAATVRRANSTTSTSTMPIIIKYLAKTTFCLPLVLVS